MAILLIGAFYYLFRFEKLHHIHHKETLGGLDKLALNMSLLRWIDVGFTSHYLFVAVGQRKQLNHNFSNLVLNKTMKKNLCWCHFCLK